MRLVAQRLDSCREVWLAVFVGEQPCGHRQHLGARFLLRAERTFPEQLCFQAAGVIDIGNEVRFSLRDRFLGLRRSCHNEWSRSCGWRAARRDGALEFS